MRNILKEESGISKGQNSIIYWLNFVPFPELIDFLFCGFTLRPSSNFGLQLYYIFFSQKNEFLKPQVLSSPFNIKADKVPLHRILLHP